MQGRDKSGGARENGLTVAQLICLLEDYDPDAEVRLYNLAEDGPAKFVSGVASARELLCGPPPEGRWEGNFVYILRG